MKNRIALRIISVLICAVLCAGTAFASPLSAYAEGTDETAPTESVAVPVISVTTENGNGCELQKADGAVNAHIVITDVDGSRYLIPDVWKIDTKSRRKIEPYLY